MTHQNGNHGQGELFSMMVYLIIKNFCFSPQAIFQLRMKKIQNSTPFPLGSLILCTTLGIRLSEMMTICQRI